MIDARDKLFLTPEFNPVNTVCIIGARGVLFGVRLESGSLGSKSPRWIEDEGRGSAGRRAPIS